MNPWLIAVRRCTWVSGLFCILMLAALGWNAFASRATDPNPPTHIDDLVTRLNLDPTNKPLLADLRRQDDWLRSSYFRSIRFEQIGFFLLLGGLAGFLLFTKVGEKLQARPLLPDPSAPARGATEALTSQRTVLALGIGLGGVLALVATLSRHDTVAAYVQGRPLPQITPLAPSSPQGLPPAGPASAPAGAAPITAASAPPATTASGPEPLGGTTLAPLPVAAAGAPTKPPEAAATTKTLPAVPGWTCFRGPNAGAAAAWSGPADWDVPAGKGLLWKADLGLPGWNSPIIAGGSVFLSGADDKHREICAFDLATGKNLWRLQIPVLAGTKPVKPSPDAGYAPSTMTTDGKHVFAAFVDGNVACVSVQGKPLWGRNFGPLENTYGFASSLLFAHGKLIVSVDQGSSPTPQKSVLYALDPDTGKSVWEAKRSYSASWTSPIEILVNGRPAVVDVAEPGVAAYDLDGGAELWHADGLSGEIAASPTMGAGKVFVAQQGSVMLAIDASTGKIDWNTSDPALPDIGSPAYGNGLVFLFDLRRHLFGRRCRYWQNCLGEASGEGGEGIPDRGR